MGTSVRPWKSGELYNTCCVFDGEGHLIARHRKTHLFDIDIPSTPGSPGITFKESDTLTPGDELTVGPATPFNAY
jgi:omega-amidase